MSCQISAILFLFSLSLIGIHIHLLIGGTVHSIDDFLAVLLSAVRSSGCLYTELNCIQSVTYVMPEYSPCDVQFTAG